MPIDKIRIRRAAKMIVAAQHRQSMSAKHTVDETKKNSTMSHKKTRKINGTIESNEDSQNNIVPIDKIRIRRAAKMIVEQHRQSISAKRTVNDTLGNSTSSHKRKINGTIESNEDSQEILLDKKAIRHVAKMVVDDESLLLANGTDTINANTKKVVRRQSVKSTRTVTAVNINNTSSNKQHIIKNDDKKERQTIFNEMMINASKSSNKRITRQKTKLVTNECLKLTDREIRAMRRSRGSTTSSSNIDESNTNNDRTSVQATTTVDQTIPKVTDALLDSEKTESDNSSTRSTPSNGTNTNNKKRPAPIVATIVDNSTNKKQLSERTLRLFRRMQKTKNQNLTTTGPVLDDQSDKDSTNTGISIGFVPNLPPTGNIFDDIIFNNNDIDGTDLEKNSTTTYYDDNASTYDDLESISSPSKITNFTHTPTTDDSVQMNNSPSFEKSRTHKNQPIRHIDDIIHSFRLPKTIKTSLPKRDLIFSHNNIESVNARGWKGMVNLTTMCCKQLLDTICPGPSQIHLREHMIKFLVNEKSSNRGSENRTNYKDRYEFLVKGLFDALKAAKNRSIQKRIVRALLVNGTQTQQELRNCCKINGYTDISNGRSKSLALKDLKQVMDPEDDLVSLKVSRKRISDNSVESAVKFILSTDNIKTTSWGSVDKLLSPTETIVLPKLQRITTRKIMWESYLDKFHKDSNTNASRIGRTSFHLLCKELTSCDELVLSSVDYVQALLLTDSIELLQDIVDKIKVPSVSTKFTQYLRSLNAFLKYQYPKHVIKNDTDDTCCTHGLEFALGRPGSKYDDSKETKTDTINCHECRFYSYVCNSLRSILIDEQYFNQDDRAMVQDAIQACNDCESKIQMYMAHRARCINQNLALEQTEHDMVKKLKESNGQHVQAIMIADFKMKFEPISSRETTLGHYGKRGIGWHGIHLTYYKLEQHADENGISQQIPVKYAIYLDQILEDSNRQDCLCVFSLLDAALQQIKLNLPFITELILQSDNANCYQNNFIVCSIGLLNACYEARGLKIIQFIHTETQDGKTVLDAHFATCMRFLTHFMRTWYKNRVTTINTPNGLGYALAWKGGIPNVMVQVVKINRHHVEKIFKKFQPISNQLKKYFSRVNMKHFFGSTKIHTGIENVLEQLDTLKFEIGIQSYSNIDQISTFIVDMSNKKVYASKDVRNEINFLSKGERLHADSQHDDDEFMNAARCLMPVINEDGVICDDEDNNSASTNSIDGNASTSNDGEDFEILNIGPNETNIFLDERTEIIENNVVEDDIDYVHTEKQLQRRIYKTPDMHGEYRPDNFITKVKIMRIMELGETTTRHQHFQRKDKKKNTKHIYINERKDLLARALRFASHHISTGGIGIQSAEKSDKVLEDAHLFSVPNSTYFVKGWARRNANKNKVGGLYGRKYILNYKDDIERFFEKGKKNSSDKMNPAQMRESLRSMYPNRFCIPSETEIKQEISKLFQGSKKGNDENGANEIDSDDNDLIEPTNRSNQHKSWQTILDDIIKEDYTAKPEDIWKQHLHKLMEIYNFEEAQIPDKLSVKRKIQSLKAKYKKKALTDLV